MGVDAHGIGGDGHVGEFDSFSVEAEILGASHQGEGDLDALRLAVRREGVVVERLELGL